MKEGSERREFREACPDRVQYVFGRKRFVCLSADRDCTSKTRCPRMDNYDEEFLGITHKELPGEDVYDRLVW